MIDAVGDVSSPRRRFPPLSPAELLTKKIASRDVLVGIIGLGYVGLPLAAAFHDAGLAILITDHNVRETLNIVDRAYLIFEGKVRRHGTKDFLVNDPEDVVRAVTKLASMSAKERTEIIEQQEQALRQVVDFSPAHKIDLIEQHAKRG